MTSLKQLLISAKSLIVDEDDWTTGALARDGYGELVSYTDSSVCLLCAMGAVKRAANTLKLDHTFVLKAFQALNVAAGHPITYANDKFGHAAVMDAYDKAIKETP